MTINEQEVSEGPFHEGTVIVIDKMEGRYIRLISQEEAETLSALASIIAQNWE